MTKPMLNNGILAPYFGGIVTAQMAVGRGPLIVHFGSKADISTVQRMSALTPKADIDWSLSGVRFVPLATSHACFEMKEATN